jgi:NCS1 family nucleobase:cation symporter-1
MIADYFLVRKRNLIVDDLYRCGGEYEYSNGVNPRALASLILGVAVALLGLVIPPLRWIYDYAWFVGFAVSAGAYVILMRSVAAAAGPVLPSPLVRGGESGDYARPRRACRAFSAAGRE